MKLSAQGYKILRYQNKRPIYEHVQIYEDAHGKVPKGYNVHHIDENKTNNSLRNLQALSIGDHSAIHKLKWVQVENQWHQKCADCQTLKPITEYRGKGRKYGPLCSYCKSCQNKRVADAHRRASSR